MYIALANHGARSRMAKLAMYTYLAAVRGEYNSKPIPYCRTDGSTSEAGKPTAHLQLLHQVSALIPIWRTLYVCLILYLHAYTLSSPHL